MPEQDGLKESISLPEQKDENINKDSMLNAALTMGESKFKQKRRKRTSYLTINKIKKIDYKDIDLIKKFLNDFRKIVSNRQSGTTAKQQRDVARAVHRAREMALLPFVVTEINPNDRSFSRATGRRNRPLNEDSSLANKETSVKEIENKAIKIEE